MRKLFLTALLLSTLALVNRLAANFDNGLN
jgi:hypothetical protein